MQIHELEAKPIALRQWQPPYPRLTRHQRRADKRGSKNNSLPSMLAEANLKLGRVEA